jgi:hypothetical protein
MAAITVETALSYRGAGLSVLPAVKAMKRPSIGSWKKWSARLPAEVEVEAWFANNPDAVCIVAGSVSGNLECIDFDAHGELFPKWKDSIAPEVFERLVVERTPSGGFHVLYRSDTSVPGNRKLAQGMRAGKKTTLIETRAEGGLFLCAPTEGYELIQGEFTRLAVLGQEARESLLVSAEALNECMDEVPVKSPTQGENSDFLLKPGDDWCARGDIRPILAAHGWNYLGTKQDGNELWQRPGKTGDGNSATFNGSVFCVFSTNAAPFEAKGYSKFQVYALLEHNGDFSAAAKALLDKGYGKAENPADGVDLSGILAETSTGEVDAEEHDPALDDPGVIPETYFQVPGFVSELMNFTLRTAYYPNKALAFAGAMAMLAHLTGRRYKDQRGGRFNLYLLALAKSGTGKEHPRTVNIDLATVTGIVSEFGDTFASGEGLEDSLLISPSMIYQVDEVDYLFNTVKVKDVRAEQINSMLLKLYSESKTTHIMRKKALQRGQPSLGSVIIQPHLTVLGTATPKFFYQSLTERTMENGLLARCIILEAGERGDAGNPHEEDFPEAILETIKAIIRMGRENNLYGEYPHPMVIQETPEATQRLKDVFTLADEEYRKASAIEDDAANALWARAGEKVSKLAALYAISRQPLNPRVDVEAVDWAWRLVAHMTKRMLYMATVFVSETDFDSQAKKIVRRVKAKNGRISHGKLLRGAHLDKDAFKKIIETLCESGVLKKEYGSKGGIFYVLL